MDARFGSLWQKIKRPLEIIAIIAALLVGIVLIYVVVRLYGTGFDGYNQISTSTDIASSPHKITRVEVYQPGKTLWDWLQLLIIPFVLAVGGYVFNLTVSRNERKAAANRDQTERDIALDNQQEAALQTYIDKMSELLLDRKLRESKPGDELRNVARIRTLTMLYQLNVRRINYMLAFLRESGLVTGDIDTNIITFSRANLRTIDLHDVEFYNVDLHEATLISANLNNADLSEANLNNADLSYADLSKARLFDAKLSRVRLRGADLSEAKLWGVDLSRADLSEAKLSKAQLNRANLSSANLNNADLSYADLSKANLIGAKLDGAMLLGAILLDANLSTANLSHADLRSVDLRSVDLRATDLSRASLRGADLRGVDLSGASFRGADLRGVDLSRADLTNAKDVTTEQLDTARSLQGTIMPDGSKHP